MTYTPAKPEDVWAVLDAVKDPRAAEAWDAEDWQAVERLVSDHAIERYQRPSPCPGVDPSEGGQRGAHPQQLAFRREFFTNRRRIMAASGSNQCGKTQVVGGCFCEYLRDHAVDGQAFWVVAKTSQTLRDIPCKTMWELLPREMFGGVEYNPQTGFGNSKTLELRLPGDRGKCEVWLWTEEMDLGVIESARLKGVWWTECTREVLFGALQPRLAALNGWLLMDYVPREGWHKIRIRVPAETGDPDVFHQRYRMQDNAHNLAPGEIEKQRRRMTAEEAAVRIDGKDGGGFGAVYPQFDPTRHVVEPFEIPSEFPRYRCYDYGFRNPSALLWAALLPAGFRVPGAAGDRWGGVELDHEVLLFYREMYAAGMTIEEQASRILAESGSEEYRMGVVSDPSIFNRTRQDYRDAPQSVAESFAAHGLTMKQGKRASVVDERSMIAEVRLWLEHDKLWFFTTCENAIREHQVWKYKEGRDGEVPGREPPEDKDNHACDAVKQLVAEHPVFAQPGLEIVDVDESEVMA